MEPRLNAGSARGATTFSKLRGSNSLV